MRRIGYQYCAYQPEGLIGSELVATDTAKHPEESGRNSPYHSMFCVPRATLPPHRKLPVA